MNTLQLIKKQINKASALHDAQISHTAYRGVEYNVNCAEQKDAHGTYCYRGRTYVKWSSWKQYKSQGWLPLVQPLSLHLSTEN